MRDSKMLLLLAAAVVLIPGACGRGNGNLLDDPSFEVSKSKDQFGLVFGMVQHALRRNDLWLHTLGAGVGSSGGWSVSRSTCGPMSPNPPQMTCAMFRA